MIKMKTIYNFILGFIVLSFIFFFFKNNLFSNQSEEYNIPEDSLTIAFGGDTHFVWGIEKLQNEEGFLKPIEEIQFLFNHFDFRVLNIETVISDKGQSKNQVNYVFRSNPNNIEILKELKLNLAILGNNHSFDFQEEGLKDMLERFKESGIPTIGAGININEALKPYLVELNSMKFAFFSISLIGSKEDYANHKKSGIAGWNSLLLQEITKIRKTVDYIFISIHWGKEYNPLVQSEQKKLVNLLFRNGANFIVGHHPHIPQAIEVYSNNAVVYSLGNFMFGSANYLQEENLIAVFHFDKKNKKFLGIEVYPITGRYRKYGYKIREPEEEDKMNLFKKIYYLSKKENPKQLIYISTNKKSLFIRGLD